MSSKMNDILEFISAEHQNELVSIANLKNELGFLKELDEIYQDINHTFSISANKDEHYMIATMFLQSHNELYIGMSQFFKSHLGKAFVSSRIAIDAAFNGYYFTKNPKDIKEFLNEDSPIHKKVFRRMKSYIKENIKEYPLAQNLVKLHEAASGFSAHSSFQSIAYKYKYMEDTKKKKEEISLNYFDSLDVKSFLAYYFGLLKGFFMVFQLFYNCFFKKELKVIYPEREKRIATFEEKINLKGKQYPLKRPRISGEDNGDRI
jgi:hypothetical protein